MWRMTDLAAGLRSSFVGDVLKLSFGTLSGRLIALAALPVITRLYSPDDFALLAVYLALVGTLAVAACLRLDVAIPLVESEGEAAALLVLALLALATVTAVLILPALLMPDRIASALGAPALAPHLWLVPLGVAMAGSYSALQFWSTRARRFGVIARTRVGQAAVGVAAILALGGAGISPFGLLLGNALNIGAGGFSLAASALVRDGALLRTIKLRNLAPAFCHNHRYPLLSTPEALFNMAGTHLPVILIAACAGAQAGFLLLAMQVMAAPMTLLGSSISQVYVSRAPTEFREGRLAPYTLSIMRRLVLLGAGPLMVGGALALVVFPWIFGKDWARAGQIVTWLVPWMVLQFIASPVSMVMFVVGRQGAMLFLTTLGLFMRTGGVLIAIQLSGVSPIVGFVIGSIAYYAMVAGFVMAAAGMNKRQCMSLLSSFGDWRVLTPAALGSILAYALY
jgi:O-antigen/teichoic acid export membrane protein